MMLLGLLVPILAGAVIFLFLRARSADPAHDAASSRAGAVRPDSVRSATPEDRPRRPSRVGEAASPVADVPAVSQADDLARWQAAGLLTEAEVSAIVEYERAQLTLRPVTTGGVQPVRRLPSAAEALGYLGGLLAIVGMVLLVARYWDDITLAGRLGVSGGLAVVLFAAGWFVPEDHEPALRRMRWFVWLLSSAATAVFGGVLGWEWSPDSVKVPLVGAVVVALHDAPLWWRRDRPLQQFTFLAAISVAVGTATSIVAADGITGLVLWGAGAVMVLLAWRELVPLAPLALAVGAVTSVVGANVVASDWQAFGLLFVITTTTTLVALAAVRGVVDDHVQRMLLTLIGGVATVVALPGTIGYFAEQAGVATGAVVWLVGAGLVVIGGLAVLRHPQAATIVGGAALVGGPALVGTQWDRVGPLFGVATAVGLIALGMLPGRVLLSLFGSLGLLISVPWAIVAWFPGEGRAPLLILVSGALIVAVAAFLARLGDRFRQLGSGRTTRSAP